MRRRLSSIKCHKQLVHTRENGERLATLWLGESLDKGFTLVEMLIAALIFTVGTVSLMSMILFALASRFAARLESAALKLSQQKLEQLKSYRPDDLALSISGNALNSLGEIDFSAAPDPQATSQTELTLNKTRNSKLLFETRWSIGTVGTKKVITVATRKASGSPIALNPLSLKVVVAP
jgi:prepilin-type N-terminal cleavage/methylation domain-containing protein